MGGPPGQLRTLTLLVADNRDDLKGGINDIQNEEGHQERYRLLGIEIGIGDDENQQQHDLYPKNREESLGELTQIQMAGSYQRAMKNSIHRIEDQGKESKKQIKFGRKQKPEHQKAQPINDQGQINQTDQKEFQGL